jgi:hypothetical protein
MKFKRLKKFAMVLLILLLICSTTAFFIRKESRSNRILHHLSDEEKHCLSVFLRITLFSENFAYVLFGNKPIAFTSCEKSAPSFSFSDSFLSPLDLEEKKGFEVFKKIQHSFCSKNIIVKITEDDNNLFLLMINKKNLLNMLQKHIDDFKQILGAQTTVESLFSRITTGNEYLADVIDKHEALLGILLGYGRNNSWLFYQKRTLAMKLNEFSPPRKRNNTLEKKLDDIIQNTTAFSNNSREKKYILKNPLVVLPLPGFMVDPHSLETQQLKEIYGKNRQNMKRIFSQQDFVKATLALLMNET